MLRLVFLSLFTLFLLAQSAQKTKLKDLVVEFKKSEKGSTFGKDFKYYSVLIESKLADDYDDFADEFNKAAQKYEKKVKFIFMNTDIEENWQAIEYLGLIAEDVPAVLFIVLERGLVKYKMPFDEITKANIESFIDDCLDGKGISFAKSEDITKGWDSKPVKVLVGKNFEENVFVPGRTSFVFFYAPWCTACQNTMPEVEKLGLMYAADKKVMIAKMDSTVNEVPQLPIFDVPAIALFVDGEKKPIYHTGDDRTAADFSAFIRKHTGKDDEEGKVKEEKKDSKENKEKKKKKKEEDTEVKKEKSDLKKEEAEKDKKTESVKEKKETKAKKAQKEEKKTKKESATKKEDSKKEKSKEKTAKKEKKNEKKEAVKKDEKKTAQKKDEKKGTKKTKKDAQKKTDSKEAGKKKVKTDKKKVKTEL